MYFNSEGRGGELAKCPIDAKSLPTADLGHTQHETLTSLTMKHELERTSIEQAYKSHYWHLNGGN
jgi:hypothetical protein